MSRIRSSWTPPSTDNDGTHQRVLGFDFTSDVAITANGVWWYHTGSSLPSTVRAMLWLTSGPTLIADSGTVSTAGYTANAWNFVSFTSGFACSASITYTLGLYSQGSYAYSSSDLASDQVDGSGHVRALAHTGRFINDSGATFPTNTWDGMFGTDLDLSTTTSIAEADAGSSAEAVAVAASVPLAEAGAGAQTITVATAVPLADGGSAGQALVVSATTGLADAGAATDALVAGIAISLAESGSAADALAAAAVLALADAAAALEGVGASAAVQLTQGASASEVLTVDTGGVITKQLNDLASAAERLCVCRVQLRPFAGTVARGATGTVVRPNTGTVGHCTCSS